MELILKAKDIRVEFKGRDVLDIDNLEVYDYDRIGLVGANGAGKSTLFKVLLGELTPLGCKMNRLGELAYIPQLDEVTLQEEKDFALVGKLGVKQLDMALLNCNAIQRHMALRSLTPIQTVTAYLRGFGRNGLV